MMDLAQVSEACSKLSVMLEQVLAYVDDVLAGKQLPDNQVNMADLALSFLEWSVFVISNYNTFIKF